MTLRNLFVVILIWAVSFSPGFTHQDETGFWSIQLENDLLGSKDDQFYTHGTKISFTSGTKPPVLLEKITEHIPFYQQGNGDVVMHGFEIGQTIFTPEDITLSQLIKDDRPYAGWLYLNIGTGHKVEDLGDREKLNFFLLTIGLVGPDSQAEKFQQVIHEVSASTNPEGWDNQLHDELGLGATYIHKWRRIHDFDKPRQTEMGHHVGFTLGNVYSFAAAGIMLRYGTHLKTDIGPSTIMPGFTGVPAFNPNRQTNWYIFAGIEGRLMARNIFLDGNTFRDSHNVEKENLVADLQFGFAFHFDDMRLSFTQMFRSREFEQQKENTQFGAINFTFYSE